MVTVWRGAVVSTTIERGFENESPTPELVKIAALKLCFPEGSAVAGV
jgi:hypothetical protein